MTEADILTRSIGGRRGAGGVEEVDDVGSGAADWRVGKADASG
jgi:hypothetical protein